MPLNIRCPGCKKILSVSESLLGKTMKCPGCQAAIRIPAHGAANTSPVIPPVRVVPPAPVTPQDGGVPYPTAPSSFAINTRPSVASTRTTASTPKPMTNSGESIGSLLWGLICGIGGLLLSAKKFGCMAAKEAAPAVKAASTTSRWSEEVVTIVFWLIALGLLIWGVVAFFRWINRLAAGTPSTYGMSGSDAPSSLSNPPPPPPLVTAPAFVAESATSQWWLHLGGQVAGPFTTAVVIDSIRCGDFTGDTPACRFGGSQWLPLMSWPEFSGAQA